MAKQSTGKKSLVTKEGYDKLLTELEERKKKRAEIANKLEEATEQGDLSENASYKAAQEEKELNEKRIEEIEEAIANSEVTQTNSKDPSAGLGSKVTVTDLDTDAKHAYTLVGKSESNPAVGMISIESPVGKAIFGKRKGDKVTATLPDRKISLQINSIK